MIEKITIVALVVLFLHACTNKGMILQVVGKSMEDLPDWLQKPLYSCPICMCMWWGPVVIALGIVFVGWEITGTVEMFLICAAAAGINKVISNFTPEDKKKCNCERKQRLGLL